MLRKSWRYICWLVILLLVSCTEEPLPSLSGEEIVGQTAVRLSALSGFQFRIERSGAPAYVDPPNNTISFRRAEGQYVAPDRAQAVVRVIAPGFVTEVNVISVADIQWQTNVVTGAWEELPPGLGFNPAILFDPEVGLQAILSNHLSEITVQEPITLPEGNERLYVLNAIIDGDAMFQMSNGLIGPEAVTAVLYIHPQTFDLHRAIITEPEPDREEPSIWQVDLTQFDTVVEIEPPQ